ncbi:MAG: hypothetical protein AABW99_01215 [archaeon]
MPTPKPVVPKSLRVPRRHIKWYLEHHSSKRPRLEPWEIRGLNFIGTVLRSPGKEHALIRQFYERNPGIAKHPISNSAVHIDMIAKAVEHARETLLDLPEAQKNPGVFDSRTELEMESFIILLRAAQDLMNPSGIPRHKPMK